MRQIWTLTSIEQPTLMRVANCNGIESNNFQTFNCKTFRYKLLRNEQFTVSGLQRELDCFKTTADYAFISCLFTKLVCIWETIQVKSCETIAKATSGNKTHHSLDYEAVKLLICHELTCRLQVNLSSRVMTIHCIWVLMKVLRLKVNLAWNHRNAEIFCMLQSGLTQFVARSFLCLFLHN